MSYRVIGLPTELGMRVRETRRSPFGGHPVHSEVATGHGPCRVCLRAFHVGVDRRLLLTLDPFRGYESRPLPGPVFIHEETCGSYPEAGGFPADLRDRALTLEGFGRGRILRVVEHAPAGAAAVALEAMLARPEVDYVHVRDTEAGCYDFRVERTGLPA